MAKDTKNTRHDDKSYVHWPYPIDAILANSRVSTHYHQGFMG